MNRIDLFNKEFDPANQLSGVLLIARGDTVILHKAYGMSHIGLKVPNRVDSRIGIASITKEMTSIVLSRLLMEGVLEADAPISTWIPDFPRGDEITISHLARHRAGIPHRVTSSAEESLPITAEDIVALAASADLRFDPGTRSSYSSAGYTILAHCLEQAAGKPIDELFRTYIFDPAEMKNTSGSVPGKEIEGMAQSYVPGRGELWPAPKKELSFLEGAGSVVSTAWDCWLFLQAFRAGDLVLPFEAFAPDGRIRWTGATNGYFAAIDTYPEEELTFIWLGNSWGGCAGALRGAIPKLVRGEHVEPSPQPTLISTPSSSDLEVYVGQYETRPGATNEARTLGGELWVADSMVLAIGQDRFWHQPWQCEISFRRDEMGNIDAMVRHDGDSDTILTRVDIAKKKRIDE